MTGTYAGQFVMEGFLQLKISRWKRVLLTRCVALIPALSVAILSEQQEGVSDRMDELLNVLQSIQLPFALLPVLHFTSREDIMGPFANSMTIKTIGWSLCTVVCAINVYLVSVNVHLSQVSPPMLLLAIILAGSYICFVGFLIRPDLMQLLRWLHKLPR